MEALILIGGVLHFSVLIASVQVPRILKWREELAKLDPFLRRMFWVYGIFIVLVILGFGTISVSQAEALTSGSALGRWICGFIGVFWGLRLIIQFTVFGRPTFLTSLLHRTGYHLLTLLFLYLTSIYLYTALHPQTTVL